CIFRGLPAAIRPACICLRSGFSGIVGLPALPVPSVHIVHPAWLSPVVFPFALPVSFFQPFLFLTIMFPETDCLQRSVSFHKFPVIFVCDLHLSFDVPVMTSFMLPADMFNI